MSKKTNLTKKIYNELFNINFKFEKYYRLAVSDLSKQIRVIGWSNKQLKKKKLLITRGSGRYALAGLKLGFATVHYVDFAQNNIKRIKSIMSKKKLKNLYIHYGNISNIDKILKNVKFDLIYCEGVLQHVVNETKVFKKLVIMLNDQGKFYFDLYRSGIFYWFIVELLRKLVDFDEYIMMKEKLKDLHLYNKKISFSNALLGERILDDLFTPTVRYYSEEKIISNIKKSFYKIIYRDNFPLYHHSLACHKVSRFIIANNNQASPAKINIKSISNFKIKYNENYIKISKILFANLINKLKAKDIEIIFKFIIDLFIKIEKWTKLKLSPKKLHKEFQKFILFWSAQASV